MHSELSYLRLRIRLELHSSELNIAIKKDVESISTRLKEVQRKLEAITNVQAPYSRESSLLRPWRVIMTFNAGKTLNDTRQSLLTENSTDRLVVLRTKYHRESSTRTTSTTSSGKQKNPASSDKPKRRISLESSRDLTVRK